MRLETVFISELNPAEYNPRKDLKKDDPEYQAIKRSIEEFGYVDPIIINSDYTVIGGHQRIKVLRDLGMDKIDAIIIDIDKTKEKALNLALNKITGSWDIEKLSRVMEDLKVEDFDLTVTGFSELEIQNYLDFGRGVSALENEWVGMPEFNQENKYGVQSIVIHFPTREDVNNFAKLIGQNITEKTKFLWFPKQENESLKSRVYVNES